MKKILLIAISVLFTTSLFARTLETESDNNSIRRYVKGPIRVSEYFGKNKKTDEYGVFLQVTYNFRGKINDISTLFFSLESGMAKADKYLYTAISGEFIPLAKKKWYGWKKMKGVKIKYEVTKGTKGRHGTPVSFEAWVETPESSNE